MVAVLGVRLVGAGMLTDGSPAGVSEEDAPDEDDAVLGGGLVGVETITDDSPLGISAVVDVPK